MTRYEGVPSNADEPGFWAALRRRHVGQWGIVYAGAAWVALQGLAYLCDTFGWPRQLQQLTTIALLMGLPVVLTLAWYHGDRGRQRVSGPELAILALVFAAGGYFIWSYGQRTESVENRKIDPAASTSNVATADARPSIAVLPFDNRSRLADDEFFVEGIHDDILTQLSKIGAIKVIARTSTEQFRNTTLTTKAIGQQLGVATVLEGGVQRAGDRVRVTVQLIDTATDAHLWADSFDRDLTAANIFAIQSEVAEAIATALNAKLSSTERARVNSIPTNSLAAWEAYQLGRLRMATRVSADLASAESLFREAIRLDPDFALGYAGLADALTLQTSYSHGRKASVLDRADGLARRAIKMDPNLAEAWASAALVARNRWQPKRAEAMLKRAIQLNPNFATAYHWYGVVLRDVGRADEALAQTEKALELDPVSAIINENMGERLEAKGRYDEAVTFYRKAISIDPSSSISYLRLANVQAYVFGRFTDGAELFAKAQELDPGNPDAASSLADFYFDLADDAKFAELVGRTTSHWPDYAFGHMQDAMLGLYRSDTFRANLSAQLATQRWSRFDLALSILRNDDLRNGRYDAAAARYGGEYPELLAPGAPQIDGSNYSAAIDLALVMQKLGEDRRALALLAGAAEVISKTCRLGQWGYEISDVQIHALRGETSQALARLREAKEAGWRGPYWRYFRDIEPNLASIRGDPEFNAIFADIERDMTRQKAGIAARTGSKLPPLARVTDSAIQERSRSRALAAVK